MQTQNDDSRLLQGGPGGSSSQQNDVVTATSEAASPPVEEKKKIYVGSREFESETDLIKYTQSLETKVVDSQIAVPNPVLENANKPKLSQLMFEDPEAYTELTIQEAERRIDSRNANRETIRKAKEDLYSQNPILKGHEDLVEMAIARRKNEYKDLPIRDGLSKIAQETISLITKIKGSPTGGKELPSSPAVVAGTGSMHTTAQVAAKAAPMTMVESLRQKQKRGKS